MCTGLSICINLLAGLYCLLRKKTYARVEPSIEAAEEVAEPAAAEAAAAEAVRDPEAAEAKQVLSEDEGLSLEDYLVRSNHRI